MESLVKLNLFDPHENLNREASRVKEALWYLVKCIFFLSALPYPYTFKTFLLRLFGANVGKRLIIKPRVNIHLPWKLTVGNYVWIGEEACILNFEKVTIGNNVCISQRAFLCGGNHNYKQIQMPYKNGPITLEDGCWVGACTFIAPEINVGRDAVIVACSFVTKNIAANAVYGGNPAVFIKKRWSEAELEAFTML